MAHSRQPSPHANVEHQLSIEAGRQPQSPVYMAYIYQHQQPGSFDIKPPGRLDVPYQPASQTSPAGAALNDTRGVYEHFHSPNNDHNKFLSCASDADRAAYRDLPRMAPPPFDKSGRSSIRPQSAASGTCCSPCGGRSRRVVASSAHSISPAGTLADHNVTPTGAPCYSSPVLLPADLQSGTPLQDTAGLMSSQDSWRVAYVQAYDVPPSPMGYGEGGQRPFHQDYRHYKYYGFGGRGAKTSWAHNPKLTESWRQTRPSSAPCSRRDGELTSSELRRTAGTTGEAAVIAAAAAAVRQPGTPLTKAQALLVQQFGRHSYAADKANTAPVELLEPYLERASLVTCQPLDQQAARDRSRYDKVKVTTYRQPVPGALTLTENPSPNHGSQAPFHQRYAHYKYAGFAGKGATSSWARNPKCALLYD